MTLERRTPLKRGTKGLKRDGEKARAWAGKRSPLRAKVKRRTPEEITVRERVFARDRYRCLLWGHHRPLGMACFGDITPHHLQKESQGGRYDEANLITLCAGHNGAVEDRPTEARELGLSVIAGLDHDEAARRRAANSVVP